MARRGDRAPNVLRPENNRHRSQRHAVDAHGRRQSLGPASWIVPLLLALLGLLGLVLGRSRSCLPLMGTPAQEADAGLQACTTTWAPGAIVFAVLCWLTALFVWLVQRRR